jgi:hypothetical protein
MALLFHNRDHLVTKNSQSVIDHAHHYNPQFRYTIDRGHWNESPSIIHTDNEGVLWPRFYDHDLREDGEYYQRMYNSVYSGNPDMDIPSQLILDRIILGIKEYYSYLKGEASIIGIICKRQAAFLIST